jgi:CubicO group peptidase (beta-lactamase class C family)
VTYQPGTRFVYNTGATYLLSAILHRLTGERLLDYLTPRLLKPLGITGATWERDPQGIDVGGYDLANGDGLLLDGRTAYVVRNEQELIVPVKLSGEYISGEVGEPFTDPSFAFPTTIAKTDGRLLVVNSQFDKQEGEAELPFTVSSVEVP